MKDAVNSQEELPGKKFWSEVDSIPWSRLVHHFGRATLVPALLRKVVSGDRDCALAAVRELSQIEHQDGVIQATPLVCRFLVRILEAGATPVPDAVTSLLATCFQAAQMIEPGACCEPVPEFSWLYSEAELWPPFVSEDDDFVYWEDLSRSTLLHGVAWSHHTIGEIVARPMVLDAVLQEIDKRAKEPIRMVSPSDVNPLAPHAEAALIEFRESGASLMDCIKWVRQHHECTLGGALWLVTNLFPK